ncbi:plasmid stabilization protein, partial [Streptomyces violaceoruber]
RGGQRSGNRQGPQGPTYDQLYQEAKRRDVHGRSNMNKGELRQALGK